MCMSLGLIACESMLFIVFAAVRSGMQAAVIEGYSITNIDWMPVTIADFLIFSTPVAWFVDFGPVLPLLNLYEALNDRRIGDDDLVLVVSMGSVSSATAIVCVGMHRCIATPSRS